MKHDLTTIAGVQTAIDELPPLMAAKGVVGPSASFSIVAESQCEVWLRNKSGGTVIGDYDCEFFRGSDAKDGIYKARKHIMALPDIKDAAIHRYMKKAAELVDQGRADGIPDEYVDPVSMTLQAMTDNLLPKPTE